MRMEPKIIVSLLTKGARPSDLTSDNRKAVQISKRLTKHGDYFGPTEDGKPSPKDRLCIEILEQAERRDPQLGEASVSLAIAGDCLRGKLLYLENRGIFSFQNSYSTMLFRTICSDVAGGVARTTLFFIGN
jgi:regulatory protein NPR1